MALSFAPPSTPSRPTSRPTALRASRDVAVGLGQFWTSPPLLLKIPGIINVTCGYAGGPAKKKPSYDSVCQGDGYVESLKITYDDSVISYEKVLSWASNFLAVDSAEIKLLCRRSQVGIILVETKKLFFFNLLVFGFSDLLLT